MKSCHCDTVIYLLPCGDLLLPSTLNFLKLYDRLILNMRETSVFLSFHCFSRPCNKYIFKSC